MGGEGHSRSPGDLGAVIVGVDASRATSTHPTGTETYSRRLIEALLGLGSPSCRFRLYFRTPPLPGAFPGAQERVIPFPRLWTHLRLSWEMARHPPDLLFVPAHVLPLVRPALTLATVHDLGYLAFRHAHPILQGWYLDLSTRWNARVATHLLADSEATRTDLAERYHVPRERVTVAYPGYDGGLTAPVQPAATAAAKARYGIVGDYFLYVGTLHPRKNLRRAIAAFAAVRTPVTLVLVGRHGWRAAELEDQVRRLGLESRVLFPGYIAEEDKAALLAGALAFVFPSLYEGFGLPVLEAQASGCPVLCSATSSLPEVAGQGAILLDPGDTDGWTEAMDRVANDPALRSALVERGRVNLERFSWQRCASTVLQVIGSLVGCSDGDIMASIPRPGART